MRANANPEVFRAHSVSQAALRKLSKGILRRPEPRIHTTHVHAVSIGGASPYAVGQIPVSQAVEPAAEISGEDYLPKESSLAPEIFDGREVLRCRHCQLNQFLTASGVCRKCRQSLTPEPELVSDVQPVQLTPIDIRNGARPYDIGKAVWLVRQGLGLSARQLAERAKTSRQKISGYENNHHCPTVEQIERLSAAFGIPTSGLIQIAVHCAQGRAA